MSAAPVFLRVCMSGYKRHLEKETSSVSKRVAESRIPPCPHDLTIAILIPSLFPPQSPYVFRAGNVNHNSRSDPTQSCTATLTLPKAQPNDQPAALSGFPSTPQAGCAGTKFPAADQKRRIFGRERVLLRAFHCKPGWSPADGTWGCCTVRHGTFEQRLNLIRSATVRHRATNCLSASCASACCTVPSFPFTSKLGLTTAPKES